jgi:hypothetical protein
MTTGNLRTRPGGKGQRKKKEGAIVAAWNSAISPAGMPGGRTKWRWTALGAVAPLRPSSAKKENALSTRMLPVRKRGKSPQEPQKDQTLDKKPLLSYVAIRR